MTVILFSAENQLWDTYSELLLDACKAEGIEADITRDADRAEAELEASKTMVRAAYGLSRFQLRRAVNLAEKNF